MTVDAAERDPTDPRPAVLRTETGWHLQGWRCRACGRPRATVAPRCPHCRGELSPTGFGPRATVWSSTVVHIPIGGRTPPYGLAYVDFPEGPRVLVHTVAEESPVPVFAEVELIGSDEHGDPAVRVVSSQPDTGSEP